jgi:hypothetical protein
MLDLLSFCLIMPSGILWKKCRDTVCMPLPVPEEDLGVGGSGGVASNRLAYSPPTNRAVPARNAPRCVDSGVYGVDFSRPRSLNLLLVLSYHLHIPFSPTHFLSSTSSSPLSIGISRYDPLLLHLISCLQSVVLTVHLNHQLQTDLWPLSVSVHPPLICR